jgi:hypothetical protein
MRISLAYYKDTIIIQSLKPNPNQRKNKMNTATNKDYRKDVNKIAALIGKYDMAQFLAAVEEAVCVHSMNELDPAKFDTNVKVSMDLLRLAQKI